MALSRRNGGLPESSHTIGTVNDGPRFAPVNTCRNLQRLPKTKACGETGASVACALAVPGWRFACRPAPSRISHAKAGMGLCVSLWLAPTGHTRSFMQGSVRHTTGLLKGHVNPSARQITL